MKKSILLIIILICIMLAQISLNAVAVDVSETEELYEMSDAAHTKLTRADCLIFIMLTIGSRSYTGTSYVYDVIIRDGDDSIFGNGAHNAWALEYANKCMFKTEMILTEFAVKHAGIAYGEYAFGPSKQYIFFNDFRYVTPEEATAFMVRCLKPQNAEFKDLDVTYRQAKELGLIIETDEFYNNPKKELTVDEFKNILNRFIHQPMGIYHDPESYADYFSFRHDTDKDMTYYEMLMERYKPEYIEALLDYDGSQEWKPTYYYDNDEFWNEIPAI